MDLVLNAMEDAHHLGMYNKDSNIDTLLKDGNTKIQKLLDRYWEFTTEK